jgi:hypothetical protein
MELFGKPKVSFEKKKLQSLVKNRDVKAVKTYVLSYLAQVDHPYGISMWIPNENDYRLYKFEQVKNLFFSGMKFEYFKDINCGKKIIQEKRKFDVFNWFKEKSDIYTYTLNIKEPRIYTYNACNYINQFMGFMHERKPYCENQVETKKKVNIILDHIRIVWCSNNIELYNYIILWISNAITGIKMNTFLFLKSGQGTGKSIITEFIQEKVLGRRLCLHSSDAQLLQDEGYNSQLMSKLLLVLEEAPAANKGQWMSLSNAIKNKVTGNSLEIKTKYMNTYVIDNNLSVMVLSNNNALKVELDDRRTVCLDISHEKVGDRKYFNMLSDAIDSDGVGDAFFNYCFELREKYKFNEDILPETETRKEIKIENLPKVVSYIKTAYLQENKGLDVEVSKFHERFNRDNNTRYEKITLGNELKKFFGIESQLKYVNGTRVRKYIMPYDALFKIFENKHYLHHETEDYVIPEGVVIKKFKDNHVEKVDLVQEVQEKVENVIVVEEEDVAEVEENLQIDENTFNEIDEILNLKEQEVVESSKKCSIKF